ncbi:hypothetical protein [Actinomadura oligospora]|uniref:hypothetical protein n=1 Tax=Actinomadura oligospora TaxID=111804 RepID=UPI00047E0B0A|nr:hypothetical protein [Actinomadura oligospora]
MPTTAAALGAPPSTTGIDTASCAPDAHPHTGSCRLMAGTPGIAARPNTRTPRKAECRCWRFVRPEGLSGETALTGVTAPSTRTAWAVGRDGTAPLAVHWTGSRWRRTPLPLPDRTVLGGISAASANDAWIVGTSADGNARTVHWNGRHWIPGALPASGGKPNSARGVAERAPGDVWAVGSGNGFAGTMAVTWHFNGRAWTVTPTGSGPGSTLNAVAAHAHDDAWAVGTAGTRQLLLHWNGRSWAATTPPQSAADATPSAVATDSPNNAWVVGTTSAGASLVEHWDGGSWSVVPAPLPGSGRPAARARVPEAANGPTAAVTDGQDGVWISGADTGSRPYLAHYNGTAWDISRPPMPKAGSGRETSGVISALALVPGTQVIRAAGAFRAPGVTRSQALTWTNTPRPR